MTREQIQSYFELYERVQRDEVSQSYWQDFCTVLLEGIMEEHKDVFVRLKERG